MDLSPYKMDIDDLIREFDEGEFKSLADWKRIWRSRKFSYVFEDIKHRDLALTMQIMYTHSIGHMASTNTLSRRLGGFFCFYCLYETQPFKPPFKVYLSLGELRKLKNLVIDAKKNGIKVVCAIMRKMMEKNAFLFGFFGINDYSGTEKVKELVDAQNAQIKKMHEMLLGKANVKLFLQMHMGVELDVKAMKGMSRDYANAKELAIKEAGELVDIENIKHIAESRTSAGDDIESIAEKWETHKDAFYQDTGLCPGEPIQQTELLRHPAVEQHQDNEAGEDVNLEEDELLRLLTARGEEQEQHKDAQHSESNCALAADEDFEFAEELEMQLALI
ncbi:hypothetical protein Drorol1_Dr00015859 [Drosera rotundifolia]